MKQQAEQAAARAEREKLEAIETERKRQAEAQEAERLEAERRENNKAHAKRINNEAMQDFIAAGLSEELARVAVIAIAKGVIRNIAIKY